MLISLKDDQIQEVSAARKLKSAVELLSIDKVLSPREIVDREITAHLDLEGIQSVKFKEVFVRTKIRNSDY